MNTEELSEWRRKMDCLVEELVRSKVELDTPPSMKSFLEKWQHEKRNAHCYVEMCARQGYSNREPYVKLSALAEFVDDLESFIEDPIAWGLRMAEKEMKDR